MLSEFLFLFFKAEVSRLWLSCIIISPNDLASYLAAQMVQPFLFYVFLFSGYIKTVLVGFSADQFLFYYASVWHFILILSDTHQLPETHKSGFIVSIHTPSSVSNSLQGPEDIGHLGDSDLAGSNRSVRQPSNIRARPTSSASSASEHAGAASAASGSGLSPSSSVGSLSSEKSTLNPNAKVEL